MQTHTARPRAAETRAPRTATPAGPAAAGRAGCPQCADSARSGYRDDLRFGLHATGAAASAGKPPAAQGGDLFSTIGEMASQVGTAIGNVATAIGSGVAAAAAALPPRLTKKTVTPTAATDCGGYKWGVQWQLDKKSALGGWVVQKVEMPHNVKDCDGKAQDPGKLGGFDPSWTPYWEAWQINKNQDVTTYAEGGDVFDDTYSAPALGNGTKGDFTIKGTAQFHEGLTLPASFTVKNAAPAWILPHTKTAPALTGGTGAIDHSLKVAWDCCSKDPAASKATTLTPT